MKHLTILLGLTLWSSAAYAQTDTGAIGTTRREAALTARGTFDVKLSPQPAESGGGGPFGRLLLDKQFHGDLEATSAGQMLGAMTAVEGSAGHVALELVTGTLNGKRGTFVLQHSGSMSKGVPTTDHLTGITGGMTIIIEGKKHSYEFEYALGGS